MKVAGGLSPSAPVCTKVTNGAPVARLVPLQGSPAVLAKALSAWRQAERADDRFADDLTRIGVQDAPPENPWVLS